ncbi:MAG TPA: cell division protein SepF [Acidimicrobiia bacterium]|nr:cell division protein SepF [Acidimicrobiia bacterium]
MGSIFSKAMVFLGLVDEDQGDPVDQRLVDPETPAPRQAVPRRPPEDDWDQEAARGDRRRAERPEYEQDRLEGGRRVEPRRVEQVTRVEGRRVEPPTGSNRSTTYRESVGFEPSPVRAIRPSDVQADILVVEEFGDAKILADRVRDRVPVVLDLREADPDLVRRVIDFSSGLIYALDGTMNKVAEGVVAVLPPRIVLSPEERRRLARLGVYDLLLEDD